MDFRVDDLIAILLPNYIAQEMYENEYENYENIIFT
jgi:hypothetical protein